MKALHLQAILQDALTCLTVMVSLSAIAIESCLMPPLKGSTIECICTCTASEGGPQTSPASGLHQYRT